MQAAGSGWNVLFADVIDEWVRVRDAKCLSTSINSDDSQVDSPDPDSTHASVPSPLIDSLSDDYVLIQFEPPEAPLLESDFQHRQHTIQVSEEINALPAAIAEQKDASPAVPFEQPSLNGLDCPAKSD